jgi:hypothetical protein
LLLQSSTLEVSCTTVTPPPPYRTRRLAVKSAAFLLQSRTATAAGEHRGGIASPRLRHIRSTLWRGLITPGRQNALAYAYYNCTPRRRHCGTILMMIDQTEDELRSEIAFWREFVLQWRQSRGEAAHPRAFAALRVAEAGLERLLASSGSLSTRSREQQKPH